MVFPGGSEVKASASNAGDRGPIPGSGRSPGEGNGNPLQYSCLENPWMEKPGRLQSMGLQRVRHDWTTSLSLSLVAQMLKGLLTLQDTWARSLGWEDPLEKEMANHSSTLAWKIPWTEEPGRLQSLGLQRVGHNWATSLSLFFHFRFVIAFLPSSKCFLISWMQSPSAVILEPKKIKSVTVSTVSPSICHEVIGPDDLSFLNVEF